MATSKKTATKTGTTRKTSRKKSTPKEGDGQSLSGVERQEKQELDRDEEQSHPGTYYVPSADIYETADHLYVVLEMPGVTREGLDVQLENNVLSVEGRVRYANYANLRPVYTEYNVGHFARRFRLSADVDGDNIRATLTDGVLSLELAKSARLRTRTIPVQ